MMTNDELLADLGRIALLADPPPPLTYELGYAAFALRTIDHELPKKPMSAPRMSAACIGPEEDTFREALEPVSPALAAA